jgi:hypothetical protein
MAAYQMQSVSPGSEEIALIRPVCHHRLYERVQLYRFHQYVRAVSRGLARTRASYNAAFRVLIRNALSSPKAPQSASGLFVICT